mmetsp:Transcript_68512/g.115154  ORF Transcript_68512/g.115154 Transcript_68512/m.115154 type:complete len:103 (+) Transcript_68512:474-782(+)
MYYRGSVYCDNAQATGGISKMMFLVEQVDATECSTNIHQGSKTSYPEGAGAEWAEERLDAASEYWAFDEYVQKIHLTSANGGLRCSGGSCSQESPTWSLGMS